MTNRKFLSEFFFCALLGTALAIVLPLPAYAKTKAIDRASIKKDPDEFLSILVEQASRTNASASFRESLRKGMPSKEDRAVLQSFFEGKAPLQRTFTLQRSMARLELYRFGLLVGIIEEGKTPNTVRLNNKDFTVDPTKPILGQLHAQIKAAEGKPLSGSKTQTSWNWISEARAQAPDSQPANQHDLDRILAAHLVYSRRLDKVAEDITIERRIWPLDNLSCLVNSPIETNVLLNNFRMTYPTDFSLGNLRVRGGEPTPTAGTQFSMRSIRLSDGREQTELRTIGKDGQPEQIVATLTTAWRPDLVENWEGPNTIAMRAEAALREMSDEDFKNNCLQDYGRHDGHPFTWAAFRLSDLVFDSNRGGYASFLNSLPSESASRRIIVALRAAESPDRQRVDFDNEIKALRQFSNAELRNYILDVVGYWNFRREAYPNRPQEERRNDSILEYFVNQRSCLRALLTTEVKPGEAYERAISDYVNVVIEDIVRSLRSTGISQYRRYTAEQWRTSDDGIRNLPGLREEAESRISRWGRDAMGLRACCGDPVCRQRYRIREPISIDPKPYPPLSRPGN